MPIPDLPSNIGHFLSLGINTSRSVNVALALIDQWVALKIPERDQLLDWRGQHGSALGAIFHYPPLTEQPDPSIPAIPLPFLCVFFFNETYPTISVQISKPIGAPTARTLPVH